MKVKVFFWFTCVLLTTGCFAADSASNGDEYFIVETDGIGKNRVEAIEQAWLEAIRSSVGMMVNVTTEINQDEISEKIIAHSRGLVEKYEIMTADGSQVDSGVYKVKLKAWVRKDILRDGLTYVASKGQEIAFSIDDLKDNDNLDPNSSESLDSAQSTQKEQNQAAALLLHELLKKYPSQSFVSLSIADKPKLVKDKKDTLQLDLELAFNTERYYSEFLPEAKDVFKQIAKEGNRGFYRDPVIIEAIRKLSSGGVHTETNISIFIAAADKEKNNVILPDRKNTFAYNSYRLAEETVQAYSEFLIIDALVSKGVKYVIRFFDIDGEAIFEHDDAVSYHQAFISIGNQITDFKIDMEMYLAPHKKLMLAAERGGTYLNIENDSNYAIKIKCVEINADRDIERIYIENEEGMRGWTTMSHIEDCFEEGTLIASFADQLFFNPTLIMSDGIECERSRFSVEFTMPEELLQEIKSMKIEILK